MNPGLTLDVWEAMSIGTTESVHHGAPSSIWPWGCGGCRTQPKPSGWKSKGGSLWKRWKRPAILNENLLMICWNGQFQCWNWVFFEKTFWEKYPRFTKLLNDIPFNDAINCRYGRPENSPTKIHRFPSGNPVSMSISMLFTLHLENHPVHSMTIPHHSWLCIILPYIIS